MTTEAHAVLALTFQGNAVLPSIVIGMADACIYGMIAVGIVLSFRISKTVAFVNLGFVEVGSSLYWWLTYPTDPRLDGTRPGLPPMLSTAIVMVVGAVLGIAYGALLTERRVAKLPALTRTVISLGVGLILAGLATDTAWRIEPDVFPKSPFGSGHIRMFGVNVTSHRVWTTIITVAFIAGLAYLLTRTRTGMCVKAIADDVEVSQWAGVNLRRVGTVIYGMSGAFAALAGALFYPLLGGAPNDLLFVFLRALVIAVIGGFSSLTAAALGALFIASLESMMQAGAFGSLSPGTDEIVVIATVAIATLVITRLNRQTVDNVIAEGL